MKSLIQNIFFLILISLGFSSCIHDKYPDGMVSDDKIDPNNTVLFLDVRALNPSTLTTPEEKIKSVRVIITATADSESDDADSDDSDGTTGNPSAPKSIVECNRLFEFPMLDASTFSYTLTWTSTLGQKSVYVIANEESISDEITDQLDGYQEMEDAGNLEEWLEEYSFAPEYDDTGSTIYLPYTYCKKDFNPIPGKVNQVNCWLVPVATKFVFYFENKRDNPVKINGISMAYVNQSNYMMPRIGSDSQNMEFGGEMLYWPDWLAEVSKLSWNYPEFGENEWFNQEGYGWITDYFVPDPEDYTVHTFIAPGSSDVFTVKAASEETTDEGVVETVPSSHTTRIFYLPESINYRNPDAVSTPDTGDDTTPGTGGDEEEEPVQNFYLTINLEDLGPGKAPTFVNVPVPNLHALFRNTFVVVQMVMGQGDIEIYAEIAPWNIMVSNGWVSEGNAPSNNPFAIKKK